MGFKDIFVWLFIFIVGSLIVSFLIYPSSFNSFKENVGDIAGNVISSFSSLNKISGITSIKELTTNKENYFGKNVTIKGNHFLDAFCALDTCCKNLDYDGYLYEEDKITSPSSKYQIPVVVNGNLNRGVEWKCDGELKKETFNRWECEYSKRIGDTNQYEKDNCELEPKIDCYYFETTSCECISNSCY